MRRYFITGGTGFIGRELVRQLIAKDDTQYIVCLTRQIRTTHIVHPNVSYYVGDICDVQLPQESFTDVIHGANEVNDLLQPDQLRYYYTIVEGTNRLLKWAWSTKVQRTLLLSSGAAARETLYGRAKRQSEMIARSYRGNTKIARIFSVVGPEMPIDGQYAAGRFVGMALKEKRVRFYGGESVRTYLDVKDCASALLEILENHPPLMPIDVAGEEPITVAELAHTVAQVFDVPCVKIEGPERVDNYLPDSSSVQTMTLTQSLERIRDHYKTVLDLRNPDLEPAA